MPVRYWCRCWFQCDASANDCGASADGGAVADGDAVPDGRAGAGAMLVPVRCWCRCDAGVGAMLRLHSLLDVCAVCSPTKKTDFKYVRTHIFYNAPWYS